MTGLRRASWLLGTPLRTALLGAITLYRVTLSGWLGGQCRFYPTCSRYAEEAIRARGAVAGSAFAIWRMLRCNPFGAGGVDRAPGHGYDGVVQDAAPHRDEVVA
jgi:putative membrane protein insertion efficiency factor